ncbi:peroxidase, partial [Caerostris extrusa]
MGDIILMANIVVHKKFEQRGVKKYLLGAVLLGSIAVSQSQVTTWNVRNNQVPHANAYYHSGGERDVPVLPHMREGKETKTYKQYEILDPREIDATRQEITKCSDQYVHCYYAEYNKYRTIDGTCNNIKNPSWGKADNCLRRVLPFDYADKISFPRESCTGNPLPNPRLVSNVFHKEIKPKHDDLTTHFMEWGQMLAHDLSLNDIFRDYSYGTQEGIQCCNNGPHYSDKCMSIPVPPNDPFYSKFGQTCINFVRTVPCRHCSSGVVLIQWNEILFRPLANEFIELQNTAYHDLSLVYGSIEEEAQKLRSGVKGMLDVEYNRKSGLMPPTVPVEELCISPDREKAAIRQPNQNPFLLTVHTYLLRHHNFICQELSEVNPHWDDEKLYQEA